MKKKIIEPFQDTTDQIPVRRISRTIAYQNSRSIQEEDDENSSSNYKPHHNFLITCPIQPPDGIGSDMRVPTLNTNAQSNKSFERFQMQKDSKRLSLEQEQELVEDKSIISVESNNSLIRSKKTLDENRIRSIMIRFLQKLKPKYNISKFYDSLRDVDSQGEETFFKYRIFTYVQFAILCICNTLSAIYVPLRVVSMLSYEAYIFSQLIQAVTLFQIIFDLLLQRGPFKMIDGTLKTTYKCNQSKIIDIFRLSSLIILYILEDNHKIGFIFIGIYLIFQLYRVIENQENIPILIQQMTVLVLCWVSITIYLMTLLKAISQFYTNNVFNNQELGDLEFSLTLAIQLATHNSTIFYQLSNTPEILVVNIYMILTVFLGFYTFSVFFMWVKPDLKQIAEKEKVLQEFNEGLVEKNMSYSLQCRTSSYLDFIMNEDFIRLKDQLYKKLSPELQEDFQLQMRSNVISKIKFLNKFSSDFKRAIIYWFDQAQYNPEDIILQENTIDDFSLFYILKGQVKIQFQGPFDGKPKKSFVTLSEGQTFGEFSFLSGTIPYISASSYGLSKVLKIKRADFIELIKGYPQDNELFCAIRDSSLTNQNMYECYYCKEQGHKLFQCKYLLYFPNKQKVIEQYIFPYNQTRVACERKKKGPRTMEIIPIVVERVQAFKIKLSQELITSEDLPQSSQMPYSENQTQHSASYVSKTQSIMRKNTSPDNQNSQNNLEDQDQFNDIQHYSEDSLDPFLQINQRNKQNKTTLRTAGFPFQTEFGGEIIQRERLTIFNDLSKPILDQQQSREETNRLSKQSTVQQNSVQNSKLRGQRSMQSKLTFRIQNQSSGLDDSVQIQHQQQNSLKQAGSLRQASNRSNTYSNPISNGLSNNQSNNPSSNSRNNKSPKLSPSSFQPQPAPVKKEKLPLIPSDKSLQDSRRQSQRKKSTKTGTKVSILNQMSGFQPFQTVENNVYIVNDILTQKFERMQKYKKFFPHNNYDFVIARYNKAQPRLNKFTRKKNPLKAGPPLYSVKVFVMSKIRRMKKLLSG
ncbi:hypothetical protein pb186bvf_003102 [Paramecium bursaria]